jgi:hypothetical protein
MFIFPGYSTWGTVEVLRTFVGTARGGIVEHLQTFADSAVFVHSKIQQRAGVHAVAVRIL